MDTRLQELVENIDDYTIGLDDTFSFKCRGCGKCCKQREDIILSSKDIFRMSKHLNITPDKLILEFCDTYVGADSRIPIVRIAPRGVNRVCPFLEGRRCKVHESKPVVCALYPVGRMVKIEKTTEALDPDLPISAGYIIQPTECGSITRTHTVRSWLEKFHVPTEDEFYILWNQTIFLLTSAISRLEKQGFPEHMLKTVWNVLANLLYVNYDLSKEFLPQFASNKAKIQELVVLLLKWDDAPLESVLEDEVDGE